MSPAGIEPTSKAPEAFTLSIELRGQEMDYFILFSSGKQSNLRTFA